MFGLKIVKEKELKMLKSIVDKQQEELKQENIKRFRNKLRKIVNDKALEYANTVKQPFLVGDIIYNNFFNTFPIRQGASHTISLLSNFPEIKEFETPFKCKAKSVFLNTDSVHDYIVNSITIPDSTYEIQDSNSFEKYITNYVDNFFKHHKPLFTWVIQLDWNYINIKKESGDKIIIKWGGFDYRCFIFKSDKKFNILKKISKKLLKQKSLNKKIQNLTNDITLIKKQLS